jgi:hypothetical protein
LSQFNKIKELYTNIRDTRTNYYTKEEYEFLDNVFENKTIKPGIVKNASGLWYDKKISFSYNGMTDENGIFKGHYEIMIEYELGRHNYITIDFEEQPKVYFNYKLKDDSFDITEVLNDILGGIHVNILTGKKLEVE